MGIHGIGIVGCIQLHMARILFVVPSRTFKFINTLCWNMKACQGIKYVFGIFHYHIASWACQAPAVWYAIYDWIITDSNATNFILQILFDNPFPLECFISITDSPHSVLML